MFYASPLTRLRGPRHYYISSHTSETIISDEDPNYRSFETTSWWVCQWLAWKLGMRELLTLSFQRVRVLDTPRFPPQETSARAP